MNRKLTLITLITVGAMLLTACGAVGQPINTATPTAPAPTQTLGPTQTPAIVVVTATNPPTTPTTAASVTPKASNTPVPTATNVPFVVADPVALNELPHDLSVEVVYVAPPTNCATENDPNVTCSTREGQPTKGNFVLNAQTVLVMTGDGITISNDGKPLDSRPNIELAHDLWVIANLSNKNVTLEMDAPNGSFRGYFTSAHGDWTPEMLAHVRDLHLERFLKPEGAPDKYTPTPVPNCKSFKKACDETNVRGLTFDGKTWEVFNHGVYHENVLPILQSNWEESK